MPNILDIYDSEIMAIQEALGPIKVKALGLAVDRDALEREIIERMYMLGFRVEVVWNYTNVEDCFMPTVQFNARTNERFSFDPDRMRHEIVNDVAKGLGGVETDRKWLTRQIAEYLATHLLGIERHTAFGG